MEPARARWGDDRLDEFARAVEQRFDRVDSELSSQRRELGERIDALGIRIDARIDGLNDGLNGRFDALQRTLIQVGFAQVVMLLGTLVTVLVTR